MSLTKTFDEESDQFPLTMLYAFGDLCDLDTLLYDNYEELYKHYGYKEAPIPDMMLPDYSGIMRELNEKKIKLKEVFDTISGFGDDQRIKINKIKRQWPQNAHEVAKTNVEDMIASIPEGVEFCGF